MNLIKTVLISLLVLFTFAGNIGLRVFTHSCEEDGIFRSYFVELQDHCEEGKKDLPPCCQRSMNSSCTPVAEDDCCSDQVDVYKISLDYFSQYEIHRTQCDLLPTNSFSTIQFLAPVLAEYNAELYIHPPPKLSGKQLLIRNQVFRI